MEPDGRTAGAQPVQAPHLVPHLLPAHNIVPALLFRARTFPLMKKPIEHGPGRWVWVSSDMSQLANRSGWDDDAIPALDTSPARRLIAWLYAARATGHGGHGVTDIVAVSAGRDATRDGSAYVTCSGTVLILRMALWDARKTAAAAPADKSDVADGLQLCLTLCRLFVPA